MRVRIFESSLTGSASIGVTIPSPSSPFSCSKAKDQKPDCISTRFATTKTDLNPNPFSPIVLLSSGDLLELLPVRQMATMFDLVKPSSFVSTRKCSGVISKVMAGGSEPAFS